jgi:hypothetical protein
MPSLPTGFRCPLPSSRCQTPQPAFSIPIPPDIHDTIQFTSAWTAQHTLSVEKPPVEKEVISQSVKCFNARVGVPVVGTNGEPLGSRWDADHSDGNLKNRDVLLESIQQ